MDVHARAHVHIQGDSSTFGNELLLYHLLQQNSIWRFILDNIKLFKPAVFTCVRLKHFLIRLKERTFFSMKIKSID